MGIFDRPGASAALMGLGGRLMAAGAPYIGPINQAPPQQWALAGNALAQVGPDMQRAQLFDLKRREIESEIEERERREAASRASRDAYYRALTPPGTQYRGGVYWNQPSIAPGENRLPNTDPNSISGMFTPQQQMVLRALGPEAGGGVLAQQAFKENSGLPSGLRLPTGAMWDAENGRVVPAPGIAETMAELDPPDAPGNIERTMRGFVKTDGGDIYPIASNPDGSATVMTQEGPVPYDSKIHGPPFAVSQATDPTGERMSGQALGNLRKEKSDAELGLKQLDRLARIVNVGPEGLDRVKAQISRKVKRALGRPEMSDAEMAVALEQGELGKLVGSSRVEFVGPGAFTDSERAFVQDLILGKGIRNKQEALARLRSLYEDKMHRFNEVESRLAWQQNLRGNPYTPLPRDNFFLEGIAPFIDITEPVTGEGVNPPRPGNKGGQMSRSQPTKIDNDPLGIR